MIHLRIKLGYQNAMFTQVDIFCKKSKQKILFLENEHYNHPHKNDTIKTIKKIITWAQQQINRKKKTSKPQK